VASDVLRPLCLAGNPQPHFILRTSDLLPQGGSCYASRRVERPRCPLLGFFVLFDRNLSESRRYTGDQPHATALNKSPESVVDSSQQVEVA
jgi:hypothetical protein